MLAIPRFVRGSLTLADTGEQPFPLLCAINVPLACSLTVLRRCVEASTVPIWRTNDYSIR